MQKYYDFLKKSNTWENKNVKAEEELDCIDVDDIGNLEDSPRPVFIDQEFGNLVVVNNGRELTENTRHKKSNILQ